MKTFPQTWIALALIAILAAGAARAAGYDPALQTKEIAEAGSSTSTSDRTDMLAPYEAAKLEAETVKLIAEAYRTLTEANLNIARTEQIYTEIAALQQRMRLREYEFNRIAAADYAMNMQIAEIERNTELVKPLVLGRASWQTWVGLEFLMEHTADADIIVSTMFDIAVDPLPSGEFIENGSMMPAPEFPGGNLGQLYTFTEENDLSFKKFGKAHKYIMKVLAMVSRAGELRIDELRDVNQAVRLTIASIFNP